MRIPYYFMLVCWLAGCQQPIPRQPTTVDSIFGYYVTESYFQRDQGYDWKAVWVKQLSDTTLEISIRSRADIKHPTCTFDCMATKYASNLFKWQLYGDTVVFTFSDQKLEISGSENLTRYYCSGGGDLSGTYFQLDEVIDTTQIDPTIFHKSLELQGINFWVRSEISGSGHLLTVKPAGLELVNDPYSFLLDGEIIDAEIEDLNSDGFPELLIYVRTGDGKADVIGFSVNAGKSMSMVYYPPIEEDEVLAAGYDGEDEFTLVETSLIRRFPIFEAGKRTNTVRQVQYVLLDGEASRYFKIKEVTEYTLPPQ